MNQILNIFRKDTRRFWPEISLSVVVTFAFVLVYPNLWRVFQDLSMGTRMLEFIGIVTILMTASWWLLIARVVHAENLVGDQQFWITRPYEWSKLLTAKILFLAAWIGVPYLLAQFYLLVEAGFHPLSDLPRLFYNLLLILILFLLPVLSLATVTSTFARLILTLLGGFIVFVGFLFVVAGPQHGYTTSQPYTNVLLYPLLFVGCAAAIVLQYATRKTWLARGLMIALPILLSLSVYAYRRQFLIDRAYPQSSSISSSPVVISSTPNAANPVVTRSWENQDFIEVPVQYSGVADGYAVFGDDFKFTITAADGSHWSSPWEAFHERIPPGTHYGALHLQMSPALYDKFKSGPVTLQITFALSRYQADTVTHTVFPGAAAAVRGFGLCSEEFGYTLRCRSALRQPPLTHAVARWTNGSCSDPGLSSAKTVSGDAWFEPASPDFELTLVLTPVLRFSRSGPDDHSQWQICPGSPLTLSQYHLVERTQSDVTLTNFVLPATVKAT